MADLIQARGAVYEEYRKIKWAWKPYEIQQEVIDVLDGRITNSKGRRYRFVIPVFGRQSGKSWLGKYSAINRATMYNHRVMWVASSSNASEQHWNELVTLVKQSKIPVGRIREQKKTIEFLGGGVIQIRSALEGERLRGATQDLIILDEVAFYRDGYDMFYSVLLAMITASRGSFLLPTTPNGRNWFYKLFTAGLDPKDDLHISWQMKSENSPYQDRELLAQLKKTMPKMKWLEEFEAEFLADSGGVFSGVLEASTSDFYNTPIDGARYVAGVDWGDVDDYTVFNVLDILERKQVFIERFTDIGTKSQLNKVIDLIRKWKPETAYVERNGMGHTMYNMFLDELSGVVTLEDLVSEEGSRGKIEKASKFHNTRIVGVHVDNREKREMIERLSADIEYGRFRLIKPEDAGKEVGDEQISEMSTFIRKRTPNGVSVTYEADSGSHDDMVDSLALAYRGMPKPITINAIAGETELVNPFNRGAGQRIISDVRQFNNKRRRR